MIEIDYFMSHGSPWTFLGHNRVYNIVKEFNVQLNMYPVNYGETVSYTHLRAHETQ